MAADYKTLLGLVRDFLKQCDHRDVDAGFPALFPDKDLIERARAAIEPSPPKPVNDAKILHSWSPDECCAGRLTKAAQTGALDTATHWDCPKCETRWLPTDAGNIRRWEAEVIVEVLR